MNQLDFIECLQREYERNLDIARKKNADYANPEDAFQNLRLVETLTGGRISTADGIVVRMCDKFQRLVNLLDGRTVSVKDESLLDTLSDLANYATILRIYLEHEDS